MPSIEPDIAVTVRDLGKCYRLYDRPQDRLKQGFWPHRRYFREFWALRDISFSVRKGETFGIVGRNGSGKSTLLQIIAGTLTPTTGTACSSGRVAALLELGTGFNPEFTGRENVFVNGAILGMSRAEVNRHFQEIVDFAEIGDFIDQPVRTYSSGMLIRLAFAVQAVVPKDVLIVDEVLAVGDEAFQRKCFHKIEQFRKKGGTILFVSHDARLVIQLCSRALVLDQGERLYLGEAKNAVHLYQKLLYAPPSAQEELRGEIRNLSPGQSLGEGVVNSVRRGQDLDSTQTSTEPAAPQKPVQRKEKYDPKLVPKNVGRYKSRGARIQDPQLTTLDGTRVNLLQAGEKYLWSYRVVFDRPCTNVRFGMMIKTVSGMDLGGGVTAVPGAGIADLKAGTQVRVCFKFQASLWPATYFLNAGVVAVLPEGETYLDRWVDAGIFKILPEEGWLATGFVNFNIEPSFFVEESRERIS